MGDSLADNYCKMKMSYTMLTVAALVASCCAFPYTEPSPDAMVPELEMPQKKGTSLQKLRDAPLEEETSAFTREEDAEGKVWIETTQEWITRHGGKDGAMKAKKYVEDEQGFGKAMKDFPKDFISDQQEHLDDEDAKFEEGSEGKLKFHKDIEAIATKEGEEINKWKDSSVDWVAKNLGEDAGKPYEKVMDGLLAKWEKTEKNGFQFQNQEATSSKEAKAALGPVEKEAKAALGPVEKEAKAALGPVEKETSAFTREEDAEGKV